MWYEWDDLESFNQWHNKICQVLGIPNEDTIAYTKPFEVEGKIIAVVHPSESSGLIATNLRLPEIVVG